MCCSGQNETKTTTTLPGNVQSAYDTALQKYTSAGNTPYTPYTGERVAGFTDDQNSAFGAVNAAQGLGQPYINTAAGMTQQGANPLTTNDIMARYNPAIQGQVDALQNDLYAQNARTLQASNSNATKLGALTGDRSQVAAQIAQDPANRDAAMATSQLRSNAFNQASGLAQADQNRMLAAGQQYAGLGQQAQNQALQGAQAQLATGGLQQQYEQAKLDAPYQDWLTAQAYPYMQAQFLGQGVSQIGGMYPTTTTTTTPKPSLWSQIAGLGATAAGAYMSGGTSLLGKTAADGGRIEGYAGGGAPQQPQAPVDPEFAQMTANLGQAVQTMKGHMNGGAVHAGTVGNETDYGYAPGGAVTRSMAPPSDPDLLNEDWADRTQRQAGVMPEPEGQFSPWTPVLPRLDMPQRSYHPDELGTDGMLPLPADRVPPYEYAVGGSVETQGDYWKLNPGKIQVATPEIQKVIPESAGGGGGGRGARVNSHQSVPQGSGGDLGLGQLGASIGKYYGTPSGDQGIHDWGAGTTVQKFAAGGAPYDGRSFSLEQDGMGTLSLPFDVNGTGSGVPGVGLSDVAPQDIIPTQTAQAAPTPTLDGTTPSDLNPTGGVGVASSPYTPTTGGDGSYYETDPWQSVMMGGAATMAGDSPYGLINVGRGVATGLNSYMKGLQQDREARVQERAAARAGARLAQQAEMDSRRFGLDERRQAETERHNQEAEAINRSRYDKEALMEQRARMATEAGLIPGTAAYQHYILTGKMPTGVSTGDIGQKIAGGLNSLAKVPAVYGEEFANAVGPYRGDPEGGGILGGIGRAWGSFTSGMEGDVNSPRDVRRDITSGIESLASVIKPLIRSPGEGAWTDADQKRLNYVIGDLTMVNDAQEYYRALHGVNQRIQENFGIKLPELQIPEQYQNKVGMPGVRKAPPDILQQYPEAVYAPDGRLVTKDPNSPSGWSEITP